MTGNIYALPLDAGPASRIHESRSYLGFADVSPDGQMVVYVAEPADVPEVWISDIDGRNARRLTDSSFPEEKPIFSHDGKSVAFVRRMSLGDPNHLESELFTIQLDGKDERRLTNDRCVDSPLRFSQDGDDLYFTSERSWGDVERAADSAQLFRLSLDTLSITPVLRLNLISASDCCDLSMDEKTVVFLHAPNNDFAYDVFTCNVDGSDRQRRTRLGSFISSVRFGFHSQHFAFSQQDASYGPVDLYVYDVESSTIRKVRLPKELEE